MDRKILKKRILINLIVFASIFTVFIGVKYLYRHFLISSEINEIKDGLVQNSFCIVRFENNGENILIDRNIPCGNKISFTESEINILLNDTLISCNFEITYSSMILIENSNYLGGILNNEYSVSITKNGVNLLSDNILIIAR